MFKNKKPTKVASPTNVKERAMDDSVAFAKVVVAPERGMRVVGDDGAEIISSIAESVAAEDARNTVYIRSNTVTLYERMYLIAMSTGLLHEASDYYSPSLIVDYEKNSDVWEFISDTNKSKQ